MCGGCIEIAMEEVHTSIFDIKYGSYIKITKQKISHFFKYDFIS